MLFQTSIVALVAAASAVAHFSIDYPPMRAAESKNQAQFCSGQLTPTSPRTPFPLAGGPIRFNSHHEIAVTGLLLTTSGNPQSFDDFTKFPNGTAQPLAKDFFQVSPAGIYCFNIDLTNKGYNLTNGSLVTIQMQQGSGHGNLFNCADLILIDGYSIPSNETCAQDISLAANATVSGTQSIGAASETGSMTMSMGASASASAPASGAERQWTLGAAGVLGAVGAVGFMLF